MSHTSRLEIIGISPKMYCTGKEGKNAGMVRLGGKIVLPSCIWRLIHEFIAGIWASNDEYV